MAINKIRAQQRIVSIEHDPSGPRLRASNVRLNVVPCMEHQRCTSLDAYVADAKE
jgi:hypothetical protein